LSICFGITEERKFFIFSMGIMKLFMPYITDKPLNPVSAFPVWATGFKFRRQAIKKRQLIYNYMITMKIK